jgi:hypothetical protein
MAPPEPLDSAAEKELITQGWEAALRALRRQAAALEGRGATRAAVTLYDAIRIVRTCEAPSELERLTS